MFFQLSFRDRNMLSEDNLLPSSEFEAKKILSALGMEYGKIHACPNDDE